LSEVKDYGVRVKDTLNELKGLKSGLPADWFKGTSKELPPLGDFGKIKAQAKTIKQISALEMEYYAESMAEVLKRTHK